MIRKVPDVDAWVLKKEHLSVLLQVNRNLTRTSNFLKTIFCLPILTNNQSYWDPLLNEDVSDIILVTTETPYQTHLRLFNEDKTMKMEYIEEINKIWNEFYV